MGNIAVHRYGETDRAAWDEFVVGSLNGTFMHTRRFLDYHHDRFEDRSIVVTRDDRMVGVLSAAVDPSDVSRVVSHPGLSYGGLVRDKRLLGEPAVEALELVRDHYAHEFDTLRYKPIPSVYHRRPLDDEGYALFRLDAQRWRSDVAAAIRLADAPAPNSNRRRSLRRAKAAGLELSTDLGHLREYWDVLTERLAHAHDAEPAHTLSEITHLAGLFPSEITLVVARDAGEVCAGVVLFDSPTCSMAQYIASDKAGRSTGALDLVFEYSIDRARKDNRLWFNFGTCNEQQGRYLNQQLLEYKVSFGAGALAQDQYELALR